MNKFLVEFMGIIVLLYTKLLTEAEPTVMAIVYFFVFFMTRDIVSGFFNPLAAIGTYLLGRVRLEEALYNIAAQTIGMLCVVITFLPVSRYIENV